MCATGEGWYNIMMDFAKVKDVDFDCVEKATVDDYEKNGKKTVGCGVGFASVFFFIMYIYIVSLILLNLFIAVTI